MERVKFILVTRKKKKMRPKRPKGKSEKLVSNMERSKRRKYEFVRLRQRNIRQFLGKEGMNIKNK